MKQNKRNIVIFGILVLVIIMLLVALFFVMKDNKNTSSKKSDEDIIKSYVREVVCSKKNDAQVDEYDSTIEFVLKSDATGEIKSYSNRYINVYRDKKIYETIKNSKASGYEYKFDDSKLQVIKIENFEMKNEAGEVTSIWYKDYIKNLITDNYKCEEK